jgi:hypothetical protein
MHSPTLTALLVLTTTSAVLTQDPLRITGFDTGYTGVWGQHIEDAEAAVRYDELTGEHTLLFVHTTIDETVAGPLVTAGIISALPFLASPTRENWQLTAPELAAMSGYDFSGEQPMVPPQRLANHISNFVTSGYSSGYGTNNAQGSGYVTQTTASGQVAPPPGGGDERRAWANSTWTPQPSLGETAQSFSTIRLGRESIFQAAYAFAADLPNAPPINDDAIEALNALMDSKLGFEVYIQAVHIKPPTNNGGEIEVRLGRHGRVRRRSLHEGTLGWVGPDRYAPHPFRADVNVWLAPTGDSMHIIFPVEIGSLANPTTVRAYVPTSNGVVAVDQVANPIFEGQLLRPNVGIFPCPPGITTGIVLFERISEPGIPVAPIGHINRGAYIWPFTPPPQVPGNGQTNQTGSTGSNQPPQ